MNSPRIPISSITARWNFSDQAVDLVIDERLVIDMVDPQRQWGVSPFARRFSRGAVRRWLADYRGEDGGRDARLADDELEIAVCAACGDLDCGNLAVEVERLDDTVIWKRPHWAGDVEENEDPAAGDPESLLPQVLVFSRAEYVAALMDVERFIARPRWYRETPEAAGLLGRLRNRYVRMWRK